jgi:hypothetical protein
MYPVAGLVDRSSRTADVIQKYRVAGEHLRKPLVDPFDRLHTHAATSTTVGLGGSRPMSFHVLLGVDTINAGSTHSTQRAQPRNALPCTPWAP